MTTYRPLALIKGSVAVVLVLLACGPLGFAPDSSSSAKELALRDLRAAGQLNYQQMWNDRSSCWQQNHPDEAAWEREQEAAQFSPTILPADTTYAVIAAHMDGMYWRVEVRAVPPAVLGYRAADYEIDVAMVRGRLAVVDTGTLGHPIRDDCKGGSGQ